jgi:hypothetical protein
VWPRWLLDVLLSVWESVWLAASSRCTSESLRRPGLGGGWSPSMWSLSHWARSLRTVSHPCHDCTIDIDTTAIGAGFQHVNHGWRYMVGLGGAPAIVQLVSLFFLPESRECVSQGSSRLTCQLGSYSCSPNPTKPVPSSPRSTHTPHANKSKQRSRLWTRPFDRAWPCRDRPPLWKGSSRCWSSEQTGER